MCLHDQQLQHVLDMTINVLAAAGFELQQEKVEKMSPGRYLGLEIANGTITPEMLVINDKPKTLRDFQQLCGSLNWVRLTEDLPPLFNLLKGGEELNSPRVLAKEAEQALENVQLALSIRQAHRCP